MVTKQKEILEKLKLRKEMITSEYQLSNFSNGIENNSRQDHTYDSNNDKME